MIKETEGRIGSVNINIKRKQQERREKINMIDKRKKWQSENFQLKIDKRHIIHVLKRLPQENYEILKNFYIAEGKVKDKWQTTRFITYVKKKAIIQTT